MVREPVVTDPANVATGAGSEATGGSGAGDQEPADISSATDPPGERTGVNAAEQPVGV